MMSRLPDLVVDSRLQTRFRDPIITHSYREIDHRGKQFSREEHWKPERFLGRGGFGQVRLERRITGGTERDSLRAVKIINKPLIRSESLDFNRELEAIAKFSNDRYKRWFVKSFGWFDDPSSIFITMEYCRYGDLHHYLTNQRLIHADEVQKIACQILEGLDQMHQNDFAHRDLKPGNILIKSMPPEKEWWIVLADFGISKRADESNGPTTAIKGTLEFMAPELLDYLEQVKPKTVADFKAADMWALGEIIFQMLTGEKTFRSSRELMKYCEGQQEFPSNRLPKSARDDIQEFVAGIMMALPNNRMNTTQSLQHRWMEPLRVEEEFATLRLEQNGHPAPESSRNESSSARWSRLSELEYDSQTAANQRTVMPEGFDSPNIIQTRLKSKSGSPPIQKHLSSNGESSIVRERAPVQTSEGHSESVKSVAKCLRTMTLKSYSDRVMSVAFSPDLAWLAAGLDNGTVKLWDTRSGKCLQTLKSSRSSGYSPVWSVAFSPDLAWLAAGLDDGTVKLWDTRSGERLQNLKGHKSSVWSPVWSVTFSPDSAWLASGSSDRTIKLWDMRSGKCLRTLKGHIETVLSLAFSPDSVRLTSGSSDRTIKLWDMRSGKCLQTLKCSHQGIRSIAFSPDSAWLASGSYDGIIKLWDIRSGECLQTLRGHTADIMSIAFSPNSAWLASGSGDGIVKIWDVRSGKGQ